MESIAFDGMCRCCASEGVFKDLRSAYEWMGEVEVYADMIEECFNISMSMVENVNNGGICEVCITQLRNASNFKKQVQQTEGKFLKKIQDGQMTSNELKIEMTKDEPDDSYDATASDNEFFDPEYDIPIKNIKIEKEEAAKPKKRAAKASTSRAKKAKADDDAEPAAKRSTFGAGSKRRVISVTIQKGAKDIESTKKKVCITLGEKPKQKLWLTRKKNQDFEKHQENIKQILLNSNATPIICPSGIGYYCGFCSVRCTEPKDLKRHTLEQHDDKAKLNFMKNVQMSSYVVRLDITNLKCSACGENIRELDDLVAHLMVTHNKKFHTDIPDHIIPYQFESSEFKCVLCKKEFVDLKVLSEHMNVHYENHICDICGAGFVNKRTLQTHRERHKIGTYRCISCEKVFDTRLKKLEHERTVHVKEKNLKCRYCDEKFMHYSKKKSHEIVIHGAKPFSHHAGLNNEPKYTMSKTEDGTKQYTCYACKRVFKKINHVSQHYSHVHLNLRPKVRSCTLCDVKVPAHSRPFHLEEAHGIPAPTCNVCGKKFYYTAAVLQHQKIYHMGEKDFACDICGLKFSRGYALKKHSVIHDSVKPFECYHCQKTFKRKTCLVTHMYRHLNIKRFVCSVCQAAFFNNSSRIYHQKKHHPNNIDMFRKNDL